MSVRRSPPGTPVSLEPLPKCSPPTTYVTGAGSHPDLSKLNEELSEAQITYRKRKHPLEHECLCSDDIKQMKNDLSRVSSLLEKYIVSNAEMINQMNASITEVKSEMASLRASHEQTKNIITSNVADISSQIQDMKSTALNITSEHGNIKNQLTQVELKISNTEDKIKKLENNLIDLKLSPLSTEIQTNQLSVNEQIIHEVQERNKRQNNIIVIGIPEQNAQNSQERIRKDESAVLEITSKITVVKPIKIYRIGKYNAGKTRRIKVCFNTSEPAMLLLRNREKIPDNIKIFSDQTPAQQKYFQAIKNELTNRINKGESELTIKYINGIPTIVQQPSKNCNQQ